MLVFIFFFRIVICSYPVIQIFSSIITEVFKGILKSSLGRFFYFSLFFKSQWETDEKAIHLLQTVACQTEQTEVPDPVRVVENGHGFNAVVVEVQVRYAHVARIGHQVVQVFNLPVHHFRIESN